MLLEECVEGEDLRVVVIDHEVVAAAVRRPAAVIGNGAHSVAELIERQSGGGPPRPAASPASRWTT